MIDNVKISDTFLVCIAIIIFCQLPIIDCEGYSNVGTVLFTETDISKKCWDVESLSLLYTRQIFEKILPCPEVLTQLDNDFVDDILQYFNVVNDTAVKSQHCRFATMAANDVIGGYMHRYVLPVARMFYYAGVINYRSIMKFINYYEGIKSALKTEGQGWAQPKLQDYRQYGARRIRMKKGTGTGQPCDNILIYRKPPCEEPDDVPESMAIPIPFFDCRYKPNAIAVPFIDNPVRGVERELSARIIVKYYVRGCKCLSTLCHKNDTIDKFENGLYSWIMDEVIPRLNDDRFYVAFGGVLRVLQTLKSRGAKRVEVLKLRQLYNQMAGTDDAVIHAHRAGYKLKIILVALLIVIFLWFLLASLIVCCRMKKRCRKPCKCPTGKDRTSVSEEETKSLGSATKTEESSSGSRSLVKESSSGSRSRLKESSSGSRSLLSKISSQLKWERNILSTVGIRTRGPKPPCCKRPVMKRSPRKACTRGEEEERSPQESSINEEEKERSPQKATKGEDKKRSQQKASTKREEKKRSPQEASTKEEEEKKRSTQKASTKENEKKRSTQKATKREEKKRSPRKATKREEKKRSPQKASTEGEEKQREEDPGKMYCTGQRDASPGRNRSSSRVNYSFQSSTSKNTSYTRGSSALKESSTAETGSSSTSGSSSSKTDESTPRRRSDTSSGACSTMPMRECLCLPTNQSLAKESASSKSSKLAPITEMSERSTSAGSVPYKSKTNSSDRGIKGVHRRKAIEVKPTFMSLQSDKSAFTHLSTFTQPSSSFFGHSANRTLYEYSSDGSAVTTSDRRTDISSDSIEHPGVDVQKTTSKSNTQDTDYSR